MRTLTLRVRPQVPIGVIGLVLFLLLFAALSGLATAVMSTLAVFVLGGIILSAVALLLPLPWLVVALFVASFIVTGQLVYFARIDKAAWIPFLMGIVLLMRFPIDLMHRSQSRVHAAGDSLSSLSLMKVCIGVFFATLAASAVINASPPYQVVVTSKEYVFLWGLYLILAARLVKAEFVERIWATLPWLMLLQLPIVIYQRFVVFPGRISAGTFDAIVGAFGGNPDGGGASGAMGIFCVIGIVIVMARWRAGSMPGWQTFMLAIAGLLGIGLAEVKFMVLLLPFAFTLLFTRDIARRPLQGVTLVLLGFAMSGGILVAYKFQFNQVRTVQTLPEYVDRILHGDTALHWYNPGANNMGRVASIVFWKDHHTLNEPVPLLVGHGPGSTRAARTFTGEAQARFPIKIATTSLGVLLWETGVIGAFAFISMLGFAYVTLLRQSWQPGRTAESRQTLESMAVAVAVFVASVPYNTDVTGVHQVELMFLLCLGYAALLGATVLPSPSTSNQLAPSRITHRSWK